MTDHDSTQAKLLDEAVTSMESVAQIAAERKARLGADSDLVELSALLLTSDFSGDSQIRSMLREQLISTNGVQQEGDPSVINVQRKSNRNLQRYAGRLMTVATVAALIVFAFLAVPQLRSWAQDVIDGLFSRSEGDTRASELYRPSVTAVASPSYRSFDNVVAAETLAGHDIVTPTLELAAYWRDMVGYQPETGAVWIDFASPPDHHLRITMYPLDYAFFDDAEVSASADVIPVQINGLRGTFQGEFVAGGWNLPSEEFDRVRSDPAYREGARIATTLEWSPDIHQRRLRWQQGDWVYEITAWGGDGSFPGRDLMMEDLVALAESMR